MNLGKLFNEIVLALGTILQSLKFAFIIFCNQIILPLLFPCLSALNLKVRGQFGTVAALTFDFKVPPVCLSSVCLLLGK